MKGLGQGKERGAVRGWVEPRGMKGFAEGLRVVKSDVNFNGHGLTAAL